MSLIEPARLDAEHPQTIKKHSASLRFWHWANTLVICGSLITVLINSTIIDRANVTPVVINALQEKGVTVTDKQAGAVGHDLGDKVWEVHIYFGYALAALLLFRLVLEFFQVADQKFIRKMKILYAQYQAVKTNRELARNELAVKVIYSVFYITLIIMAITGLFLAFEDFFAPYKAIRHDVKEVHGFCMYVVLAFIAVHLAGVFLAERKDSRGIVSDMINGGKA
jgi:Ni/Fe-hydrogenase 1 B-type cytochrome subunit